MDNFSGLIIFMWDALPANPYCAYQPINIRLQNAEYGLRFDESVFCSWILRDIKKYIFNLVNT